MGLNELTDFFMWMTVLNVGILILSSVLAMSLRSFLCKSHGRLFGIEEKQVAAAAYNYLGNYRLLVIVLNIVPFLSLHLIR